MIRAVVVDDHTRLRQLVRRLLEHSGEIEVVGEASDREQALVQVIRLKPDVLLLDIHMPRLDGLGVLKALEQMLEHPKGVVLTLDGRNGVKERILAAGASALVPKRILFEELLPAIRAVMQR